VIDVLAEQRLFTEIAQTAQVVKNTLDDVQLAKAMAKEVTSPAYWNSLGMQYVLNPPSNLYRETDGWNSIYTNTGSVNQTWNNSTIPVEKDPYYMDGPGTTFASTTATSEIADSAAEDSLANVQQFYRNKLKNDQATKALQSDFANPNNNTYLGLAKVGDGAALQSLTTQQDQLQQQTNEVRLLTVLVKQVRDQNADANNFTTDFHRYQAGQGITINSSLISEFKNYTIP
jgi:hypothetical protein